MRTAARKRSCLACVVIALIATACKNNGEPICVTDFPLDQGGGLRLCTSRGGDVSVVHRTDAAACHAPKAVAATSQQTCRDGAGDCSFDADCSDQPHGACQLDGDNCACEYGCLKDSDCKKDEACFCVAGAYGKCVPSDCSIDADCGDSRCYASQDACGPKGLYCATPHDKCQAGATHCVFDEKTGVWNDNGARKCP